MASVLESDANTKKRSGHRILNINVGSLVTWTVVRRESCQSVEYAAFDGLFGQAPGIKAPRDALDLGFSAFKTSLPEKLLNDYPEVAANYDKLQFTLVDCPGHASLIRTMITGHKS